MARRAALAGAVVALLVTPNAALANGDPASDYLLGQSIFLPFGAKVDSGAIDRLNATMKASYDAGFKIKVAVIGKPSDLGTAFSLFRKPQRYAEFLGLELSFVYRDALLVVMPNGYGYSVNGESAPQFARALRGLSAPGPDTTGMIRGATVSVRRLAAVAGHRLVVPKGGGSEARDRITIAAAVVAGLALIAAAVLFRRQRKASSEI